MITVMKWVKLVIHVWLIMFSAKGRLANGLPNLLPPDVRDSAVSESTRVSPVNLFGPSPTTMSFLTPLLHLFLSMQAGLPEGAVVPVDYVSRILVLLRLF